MKSHEILQSLKTFVKIRPKSFPKSIQGTTTKGIRQPQRGPRKPANNCPHIEASNIFNPNCFLSYWNHVSVFHFQSVCTEFYSAMRYPRWKCAKSINIYIYIHIWNMDDVAYIKFTRYCQFVDSSSMIQDLFKSKWCCNESLDTTRLPGRLSPTFPHSGKKRGQRPLTSKLMFSTFFLQMYWKILELSINIKQKLVNKNASSPGFPGFSPFPPGCHPNVHRRESPEATPTDVATPMAAETMPRCSGAAKSPPKTDIACIGVEKKFEYITDIL